MRNFQNRRHANATRSAAPSGRRSLKKKRIWPKKNPLVLIIVPLQPQGESPVKVAFYEGAQSLVGVGVCSWTTS